MAAASDSFCLYILATTAITMSSKTKQKQNKKKRKRQRGNGEKLYKSFFENFRVLEKSFVVVVIVVAVLVAGSAAAVALTLASPLLGGLAVAA